MCDKLKILSADYKHFRNKRSEAHAEDNRIMWTVYDAAMHSIMHQFKTQANLSSDQNALDKMAELSTAKG